MYKNYDDSPIRLYGHTVAQTPRVLILLGILMSKIRISDHK